LCKTRGRPATDYHLTLDMDKELAMVENNDRGRQVRCYFIALERQARAPTPQAAPALPPPDTLSRTERRIINQRAWHFAQDAYETTRERMATFAASIPDPVRRQADIARWQPYHYPVERPSAGAIAALLAELSAAGHDLAACQADHATLIERADLAGEILHHVARLSNEGLARLTERALTLAAMNPRPLLDSDVPHP